MPSEKREAYRSMTRLRESLMKDKRRIGNQLKNLLHAQGLMMSEEEKVSEKWLKKVELINCNPQVGYCIKNHIEH